MNKEISSFNLQTLGARVLLKRVKVEQNVKNVIIIPDSSKQEQEQYEVVSVGTGTQDKYQDVPVKIGDNVLIEKYSGQEVRVNNEDFVITQLDKLIAIIIAK